MSAEPVNKKILAQKYGISTTTLREWLKPFAKKIGTYRGRHFTPAQLQIIYECLGKP